MPAQRAHLQYLAGLLDDEEDDYADQLSCLEVMERLHCQNSTFPEAVHGLFKSVSSSLSSDKLQKTQAEVNDICLFAGGIRSLHHCQIPSHSRCAVHQDHSVMPALTA